MREIIVDLFAGGGGASEGIQQALGIPVDEAINHNPEAIAMHKANHPKTNHWPEDVFDKKVHPQRVANGRPVGLLWLSPDCTHHSNAKGGKPRCNKRRGLAWVALKWARSVRPRVIILENVVEFKGWGPLDKNGQPIKKKKGMTFNLWANQLRGLGYEVQFRVLKACDYGAPTIRKRLFMIARCDKQPIVWPEPTHAASKNLFGLPLYRTAAECIDWSIPCPSIFERRKPLVENTLKRIARGVQKFIIDAQEPFIVKTGQTGGNGHRISSAREPLRTIVSKPEDYLVVPCLAQLGYTERKGQAPRAMTIQKPLGTVVGTGKHALVTAFLSKYFTGVVGAPIKKPMPTVTTVDHNAVVAANLIHFYGTGTGSDMRQPVPTVTAKGQHIGEVQALLIKYYGCGTGQSVKQPLHTIATKHRFGLVTVTGQQYQIADIGLRMLKPRELARATGFDDSYILMGTQKNQVAQIGNCVPPAFAKALTKANVKIADISSVKVG